MGKIFQCNGTRSIEGFVIGKSGSRISAVALNMHGDLFQNVVRYQYYQRNPGDLLIRIIPNSRYSREDENRIIEEHEKKLWGEMEVSVEIVRSIQLTKSGKQRRIISEVCKPEPAGSGIHVGS